MTLQSQPLTLPGEASENPTPAGEVLNVPLRQKTSAGAKTMVLVTLALLMILLGGDVRQAVEGAGAALHSARAPVISGPFIQVPLGQDQVNQLHHLSGNMSLQALAKMYL